MRKDVRRLTLAGVCALFLSLLVCGALAQNTTNLPAPVTFTAEQDHQNMMDQLGITQLRPGPSGDESAPNHANYDPAKANPYPDLPDALTLNNGKKVTTPGMWWKQRRPEIVEDMEREVYGRLPRNVPKVTWTVAVTDKERIGWIPVIAKKLVGHVDNSSYPLIHLNISMVVVVPAQAKGPVPVLMMFGRSVMPAPDQPTDEELEQINTKLKALLAQGDPQIQAIFERHPAYNPVLAPPFAGFGPRPGGAHSDRRVDRRRMGIRRD